MSFFTLPAGRALAAAPIVGGGQITVTSAPNGLNDTYKIGGVVTAQFDDSANTPSADTVTMDFSDFGGSSSVAASLIGGNIWQASSGAILAGTIDRIDAVVRVAVTNSDGGPITGADNQQYKIDNQAPLSTGTGLLTINKFPSGHYGPTKVGIGDKVTFAIGTLDAGDSTVWTVNLATPNNLTGEVALSVGSQSTGALESNLAGSYRFPVMGIDDAGNQITIANGTNSISVDTKRPTLDSASTETVNMILANFSEQIIAGSIGTDDFIVTNPSRVVSTATRVSNTVIRLQTSSSLPSDARPTVTIADDGGWGLYDTAGNKVAIGSVQIAADGIKPQVGPDVVGLTYVEGKNDRQDTLNVGFSENIPNIGTASDYTVVYDADGNLVTLGDQRSVAVNSVSNPENDATVSLSITDQSGLTDVGGKFQVMVDTSGNVRDAADNFVDPSANTVISDSISAFDTYSPTLTSLGLIPNSGLLGIGSTVTVYAQTDDVPNDQNLQTVSGSINNKSLIFTYNSGNNRYEATYTVAEGDTDATSVEAIGIQLRDRAGNPSNTLNTYGNSLDIDANASIINISTSPNGQTFDTDNTLVFEGTAEEGATVKLEIFSDPIVLTSPPVGADGKWHFAVSASEIGVGDHTAQITIIDKAGNLSSEIKYFSFTISAPVKTVTTVSDGSATPLVLATTTEAVTPAAVTPAVKEEIKEDVTDAAEGVIKAAEDVSEEGGTSTWQTIITIIAILIIALGVGTAGYYTYEWWASRGDGEVALKGGHWDDELDKDKPVVKKSTRKSIKKKKKGGRSSGSRPSGRW
jgi:hypothetical protein